MTPFAFPVGSRVTGRSCDGKPIDATVVEATPYSVLLDDGFWTPVALLHAPQAAPSIEDMLA